MPRWMTANLTQPAATTLSADSTASGFHVRALRDQLRSEVWRSATGWVVGSHNNKIDFNRGGVLQATVASGTYATGSALAAAIVTALEAADSAPVWACAYNSGTKKFTISSGTAFVLLFATGAAVTAGTSLHVDLGYASTDTASGTSAAADNASYQSRHYIGADLGAATAVTVGAAINHNAGAGGTFTLQWSATSIAAAFSAPDATQVLAGGEDIRIAFMSSQSKRYWVLVVNDIGNDDGFSEVGILYVGGYTEPTRGFGVEFIRRYEDLSTMAAGDHGASYHDARPRRIAWTLVVPPTTEADRAVYEAIHEAVPLGRAFFLTFDTAAPTTTTYYVCFVVPVEEGLVSGTAWRIPMQLAESLG